MCILFIFHSKWPQVRHPGALLFSSLLGFLIVALSVLGVTQSLAIPIGKRKGDRRSTDWGWLEDEFYLISFFPTECEWAHSSAVRILCLHAWLHRPVQTIDLQIEGYEQPKGLRFFMQITQIQYAQCGQHAYNSRMKRVSKSMLYQWCPARV